MRSCSSRIRTTPRPTSRLRSCCGPAIQSSSSHSRTHRVRRSTPARSWKLVDRSFGIAVHATQPIDGRAVDVTSGRHRRARWAAEERRVERRHGIRRCDERVDALVPGRRRHRRLLRHVHPPEQSGERARQRDDAVSARLRRGHHRAEGRASERPVDDRHRRREDARLHDAAVSTVVTSDRPIIAERSMYWAGLPWREAHNSFGVVELGTRWALAEGRVGGARNFHTFVLLANPQTDAAHVTVTYLRVKRCADRAGNTSCRRRAGSTSM